MITRQTAQKSRLENQTFHQRRTPPAFRDNTVPQVEMLGMTVPDPDLLLTLKAVTTALVRSTGRSLTSN